MQSWHPTEQMLRAHRLGMLDVKSAAPVVEHLRTCLDCRNQLDAMNAGESREAKGAARLTTTVAEGSRGRARIDATATATEVPVLPDYEVIRRLGEGGMGVVYLAKNTLMGRLEVLKVVAQHLVAQPQAMERFLREIQSAAKIQHRNIVSAYSAIRWNGGLILAMEYVEGQDLNDRVESKGPLPVAEACYFVHQAARGLQQADKVGMVHRDIKPANLMLDLVREKGTIKILDFGLAKVNSESAVNGGLTRQGLMLGTPDYMAPEQIRNAQTADIRADIYSLGCTMYFLLAGRPPFDGNSLYDILQAHHSNEASPLNLLRSDVPVELAALVAKLMAKEPENRFQSPALVAEALVPFFKPDGVTKPGTSDSRVRTGRGATVVETDGGSIAPQTSRKRTVVEEAPPVGPRPVRQATVVEDVYEVAPPPVQEDRRRTLVESAPFASLTIAEDPLRPLSHSSERGAKDEQPLWRRPAVLVTTGVLAVAAVGMGLSFGGKRPPDANTGASPPASRPADPEALALATTPDPATRPEPLADNRPKPEAIDVLKPEPEPAPAPPAIEDPPMGDSGDDEPEMTPPAGPQRPVVSVEPPAGDLVEKPKPAPDGLVYAEYKDIARSPSRYEGLKVVPSEYLFASVVKPTNAMVPGYGTLKVSSQISQTLSGERATSDFEGGQLGIVLDPAIAANLKSYMDSNKRTSPGKHAWKIIPTFEIRRSELGATAPWLAVITSVKVIAQNNVNLMKGMRRNVFSLKVFDGKSIRDQLVGEDFYDYLDGNAEREKLIRARLAKMAAVERKKAEAQLNALISAGTRDSMMRNAMDEQAKAAQIRRLMGR